MTATQLPQTKRMIEKLIACGFERSEFKVRTPSDGRGGYKPTVGYIKYPRSEKLDGELIQKMRNQGLYIPEWSSEMICPFVYHDEWDYNNS